MHRFQSFKWLWVLCAVLAVTGSCSKPARKRPEPKTYTSEKPGKWKDVKVDIAFDGPKITVAVANYKTTPDDYVQRFELIDSQGNSVGRRVFAAGREPKETFILKPPTKEITVLVTSTKRGRWQCDPVVVPAGAFEPPKK